jgi:hypothetical protein
MTTHVYRVKPGDSAASIARQFAGSSSRAQELLQLNYGSIHIGPYVRIPPSWVLKKTPVRKPATKGTPRRTRGVGQIPTTGVWDYQEHHPVAGTEKPCCGGCASGQGCEGTPATPTGSSNTLASPCSKKKAPMSIPGTTSFPVGFGQPSNAPITTTSVPVAMAAGWGVPIAIALVSAAAGFGLAYLVAK